MTDAPWPAQADDTNVLPDPPITVPEVDPQPVLGDAPSQWPAFVDTVARYAPIGTRATRIRFRRVLAWLGSLPDPGLLQDLKDAISEDGWAAYNEERTRQNWVRGIRCGVTVLAALVVFVLVTRWFLRVLGDHKMWPLFPMSAAIVGWYTFKGWWIARSAHRPRRVDVGPAYTASAGPDIVDAELVEDELGPGEDPDATTRLVYRFFDRKHPGRTEERKQDHQGPAATRAPAGEQSAPERRSDTPARPPWLSREELEARLLRAHKPLRQGEPLRVEDDGTEVRVDLLDAEFMGNGWQVTLVLPADFTAAKVVDLRSDIARQWTVPVEHVLTHIGAAHPGILVLWVADSDPLRTVTKWSGLIDLDEVNLHDGYVIGEDIFGREIRFKPLGTHCLTTGRSRSGKSVIQKLKLAYRLMDPHHQDVIIDPQGGEWREYADVAIYFGGPDEMDAALDYMRHLVNVEMPRRAKRLAELKALYPLRIPELKIPEWLARDATESFHGITALVEEATLLLMGERGAEWNEVLTKYSANGLKYLMQLDLTFQKISNKTMGGQGTELRDLAGETAFCGSVRSESMARMALGDEWKRQGMNPLAIQPDVHSGTFVATGRGLALPPAANHVLLKVRFTDDGEGLQVRRKALALKLRVRPALLPAHSRPTSTAPSDSDRSEPGESAPIVLGKAEPEVDLEPLRRVVAILEPNGRMLYSSVIDELVKQHPVEHGHVTTLNDLNHLLQPFKLRTRQRDLPPDSALIELARGSRRPHQLFFGECAKRLKALEAGSE